MRTGIAVVAVLVAGAAARAQDAQPGEEAPPERPVADRETVLEEVEVVTTGFEKEKGEATVPVR